MSEVPAGLCWEASDLDAAVEALGRQSGLGVDSPRASSPAPAVPRNRPGPPDRRIERIAARLGLEAEAVETTCARLDALVRDAGPALLRVPGGEPPVFLALLGGRGRHVTVLSPGLQRRRVSVETICAALRSPFDTPATDVIERILSEIDLGGRRRERARAALMTESLAATRLGGCWLIRAGGSAGARAHIRETGIGGRLVWLPGAHAAQYILWVLSWWLLARLALEGRMDRGWLPAWGLSCLSLVACFVAAQHTAGRLAIAGGALFKRKFLRGALNLDPQTLRHMGAGHFLGRVIESEIVETMAFTGGFLVLEAGIQLLLAGLVLSRGAGGWPHVALLLAWTAGVLVAAYRYYVKRTTWTDARVAMTTDLVERMVGHRTILAQQPRERWNEEDDRRLDRYHVLSRRLDAVAAWFVALAPRGWLLLGLAPALADPGASPVSLVVGIGGVLLSLQAFLNLMTGLDSLSAARVAWEGVKPIWRAAADSRQDDPGGDLDSGAPSAGNVFLEGRNLSYRYDGRTEPALKEVSIRLHAGERVLLQGPSGAGKSTLGAVLSGCRRPGSGVILLGGLDPPTVGHRRWRGRVVLVPQFHENHVLTNTLAFNLLLGRGWPPREADLAEAATICREVGLGELLDRMPAGLQQMVGESGWRLSHGERARLFVARALLQDPDVLILDESFSALDPETLRLSASAVLKRARTILMIGHG